MTRRGKSGIGLTFVVLGLAGCAAAVPQAPIADAGLLRENGSGLLLLHTSLHDEGCSEVTAALGTPVMSGRAIDIGRTLALKRDVGSGAAPSPAVVPAGQHAIVRVVCRMAAGQKVFEAPVVERGSILDGSGTVYEMPLATFRLSPGEILDGGSLRLAPTRPGPDPGPFAVAVAPSPEPWLRDIAASHPKLLAGRTVRPLATPPRRAESAGAGR